MPTASSDASLDELLSGTIDRDSYEALVEEIYESYTTVDLTHNRIRQMQEELAGSSGEDRELTEKLGIVQFAMGQYPDAVKNLEAVRRRKNAAYFLGRAYLEMGRNEDALDALEKARSGDVDLETDIYAVEALCRLRREEEAEELLERYGDEPDSPDLLWARARAAEARGEYGEAMDFYQEVLDENPDHALSLFRLALNCDLNGDDERAMQLYRRCVNLRPTYVGALINLGILCEDHDDYEEAIDCYKRVLAINPHHQQAQLYLKDAESSLNMYIDMGKTRRRQKMEEVFKLPVSNFELSARSRSALERMDIRTLGGLTRVTAEELLDEKNFGDTSLEEIEDLLARHDLELGENVGEGLFKVPVKEEEPDERLETSVEELHLSTRSRKCMERLGIRTVGQLVQMTEKELLECPNFGDTSVEEVKDELAEMGLSLKTE